MRRYQWGGVDGSMFDGLFTMLICIGIAIGAGCVFLGLVVIPWLWRLAKPWIHSITG